jgi:Domain of unknown function (DUF4345)
MNTSLKHSIWFGRIVLAVATFLFTMIALRGLFDPVGSSAAHEITLASAAGITVVRVGFGGFPLAFAVILLACLTSERRLQTGLGVLLLVAVIVTAARLLGLALDGPAPFTLHVLKPEVALIVASSVALLLERRRRQRDENEPSGIGHSNSATDEPARPALG